ncbi:MAG: DUF4922 domain-containing protein [Planctomycetota bacterium]
MTEHTTDLARQLLDTWAAQGRDGFLLSDPQTAEIATREAADDICGIGFRFRWMPHRELRGDIAKLEARGILNPNRDQSRLFRDPRDPHGRHCFLCERNIAECHPMEVLVPLTLAGREYFAGANFAWIEPDHYTVMPAEHTDQTYSRHVLDAMCGLHSQSGGRFRVLFNGTGAGATIPWHLHFQITTAEMPIERIRPGSESHYPTAVRVFPFDDAGREQAHAAAEEWLRGGKEHRSINIFVTTTDGTSRIFVFPRDQRRATAEGKGLVGGFEVAGDFVLSAPNERATFENASAKTARDILGQVRPPEWPGNGGP